MVADIENNDLSLKEPICVEIYQRILKDRHCDWVPVSMYDVK